MGPGRRQIQPNLKILTNQKHTENYKLGNILLQVDTTIVIPRISRWIRYKSKRFLKINIFAEIYPSHMQFMEYWLSFRERNWTPNWKLSLWSRINEAKTTVWRKHCRKPLFRAITNIIKIRGVKFEERELISDDVKKIQTVCRVIDRLHWISVIWWDVGDKTELGDQSGENISENHYFGLSPTS